MEPLFIVNGLFPAYWTGQSGFSLEGIEANFAYVLDGTGWKIWKRNGISTALIPVDSVSGLPRLETEIRFNAAKIPLDLIRKVTAWFSAVYKKFKSEAVGYLYYRPAAGEWQFVPPTQTATSASADYDQAPKLEGWQIVGTIHSHGSMSAFHSGVDDRDEKFFDGVHVTIGRVDSVPEHSCSLVVQGERQIVDPSVLVDGMAPADAVPASWLAAVKEQPPRGLDPFFQTRAEALYKRYYAGEISEPAYKAELGKIGKEERAHSAREAERRQKLAASMPASHDGYSGYGFGRTPAHSFGPEDLEEKPPGRVSFPAKKFKKGGEKHEK